MEIVVLETLPFGSALWAPRPTSFAMISLVSPINLNALNPKNECEVLLTRRTARTDSGLVSQRASAERTPDMGEILARRPAKFVRERTTE
jgi:hypothetical protein